MRSTPKRKPGRPKKAAESVKSIKPMSPATVNKELKALEYMFDHMPAKMMTGEIYDAAKARLFKALELWGKL